MKSNHYSYDRGDGVVLFLDGKHTAAFCHFLMGADTFGDARSASFVAYLYEFGLGISQSYEKAYEYFFSCMDDDQGEAAYNLAILRFFGLGAAQSYYHSLEFMEKSAEMGCIEAQLYLAGAYLSGYLNTPSVFAVTTLPFHKALYEPPFPLLTGNCALADENERFTVLIPSESDAMRMLTLAAKHEEEYAGRFLGDAKFLLAQAHFEGFAFEGTDEDGSQIDREKGERLLFEAATQNNSREATAYILSHKNEFMLSELRKYALLEEEKQKN